MEQIKNLSPHFVSSICLGPALGSGTAAHHMLCGLTQVPTPQFSSFLQQGQIALLVYQASGPISPSCKENTSCACFSLMGPTFTTMKRKLRISSPEQQSIGPHFCCCSVFSVPLPFLGFLRCKMLCKSGTLSQQTPWGFISELELVSSLIRARFEALPWFFPELFELNLKFLN